MNKYRNKNQKCFKGHIHDSKFEAEYCNRLLAMVQRGEIGYYEIQSSFDLFANGQLICRHIVDFLVFKKAYVEGSASSDLEAHEVKGFKTEAWRLKRKLFMANYPNIPYKVISRGDRLWNQNKSKIRQP